MPSSNVPKQQRDQLKAAEELHAQYYGEAPASETDLALVPEGQPLDGQHPELTPPPVVEPAAEVPPVVEPAAEVPAADPAADPAEGDYPKLLQMHRTLQGKYDAEGARGTEQVNALLGRVHDLEQLVASPPAPVATDPSIPSPPTESLLSSQEVEDYGQDMIDVVKRAAREEVGQELNALRAENANLQQQVGGVQQTTAISARQTMFQFLDGELNVWRQLNKEPEFVQWVENVDTFSGQPRIEMLRAAFEQNNGPRVLAFFQGFLTENAAFRPQGQNEPARQPQVDLNSLVAPGRASDGDLPRAPEGNKPEYTQADIQRFYADVNRGVYKSDPAEKDRIERDIFAAQGEGRIKG
jgi:hypothetical protein